jgi:pyruvate,water dikinase
VKKCWASLFAPRAIFYRFEKKLNKKKISVAVVVQKMIQSEVSGICFTVHPVTKNHNQMIIEAGYGLGEAIVGGKITPDRYLIKKDTLTIEDINVGVQKILIIRSRKGTKKIKLENTKQGKQKLNGRQIVELSALCRKIEKIYKCPQDIEWTLENNKFYIVQSRPITTNL